MAWRLDWASDGAAWPQRDRSRFVEAAGLRWHVQQAAPSAAPRPRVLLVHGTGASTHSWTGVIRLLGDTVDWLAVDLPGHAFTSMPPAAALSLPGMAAALAELLGVMRWQPTLAVGHSAGAAILLRMALDGSLPVQAIAAINGAFVPYGGWAAPLVSPLARLLYAADWVPRMFARRAADPAVVRRLVGGTGSKLGAEALAFYAHLLRSPGHNEAALGMMAHWDLRSLQAELPQLVTPLHLLVADGDRAVPPRQARNLAASLPGTTLTVLPRLGHLAHEESPMDVAEWLRALVLPDGRAGAAQV